MPGSKTCPPGCDCGSHRPRTYRSGRSCPPGCTCGRHSPRRTKPVVVAGKPCPDGCTCGRHGGGAKLSPSEKQEKERQRMRVRNATPERREWRREWRNGDPANMERDRQHSREWRQANPERAGETNRLYRTANRGRLRVQRRFSRLGLTADKYARMWEAQEGRCCYCGDELSREPGKVVVDHDHTCCPPGRACDLCRRGLACGNCNVLVGMGRDDPDRIERVAANLRRLKTEARERIGGKAAQGELPLGVTPIRREVAG